MRKKSKIKLLIVLSLFTILSIAIGGHTNVFAASGHYFCAGLEDNTLSTQSMVVNSANAYSALGYSGAYKINTNFATLTGTYSDGTKCLESKVLFLTGHGNDVGNSLVVSSTGVGIKTGSSNLKYAGVNNINFNNTKLVTLAGCRTSYNDSSLAVEIYRRGADNVIGWRQSVFAEELTKWITRYNSKLKSGSTVWDAVAYAGQINYKDSRVKDVGFFGSANNKINSVNIPVSTYSLERVEESKTERILEDIVFTNKSEDFVALNEYISSKYPSFKQEEYETKVYEINKEQNLYLIDYLRKVNGFYTDLGYVVTVTNGKVESITNNNNVINESNNLLKAKDISNARLEECKQEAIQEIMGKNEKSKVIKNNDIAIEKQEQQLYLDVNTDKQYCKVFTTYKNANGIINEEYSLIEI